MSEQGTQMTKQNPLQYVSDQLRELREKGPVTDQPVARRAGRGIDRADQAIDHDREHGALDQSIADQIDREPAAPEPLAVVATHKALRKAAMEAAKKY